jgi:hypothetical protein
MEVRWFGIKLNVSFVYHFISNNYPNLGANFQFGCTFFLLI